MLELLNRLVLVHRCCNRLDRSLQHVVRTDDVDCCLLRHLSSCGGSDLHARSDLEIGVQNGPTSGG